jgi:membrane peptidoglycan carboxypeptidase
MGAAGAGMLYTYAGELPSLDHLSTQQLAQSTRIFARDGTTLLDERFEERRTVVPLSSVAWDLRHATIAIEDKDFYNHGAVNPVRLVAAAVYDVIHRKAAQGGSTITQQLIKNYLLGSKGSSRSLDRKIREFLLAMQVEQRNTKDQILEMYLNTIFYGNQAFGIQSAAATYFGKNSGNLDLAEASFLAGLPQRPSAFNPFRPEGFKRAKLRQRDVLNSMVRDSYISSSVADKAFAEDLQPKLTAAKEAAVGRRPSLAPHFVDYVWDQLEQRYDNSYLLRAGLRVVTTLDVHSQNLALQAVQDGVKRYGPSNRVNNGAMLVMNPHTGEVLAMVGSADYFNQDISGQVNYTLTPRQPGSSFKPYTYVTALLNGWTPASPLDDSNGAKAFPGWPGGVRDWDGRELGQITLRESLQKSRNISSVHLFKDVGMEKVFSVARGLGITTKLEPVLPTTLGANEIRMIEHLSAYSAFANGGTRVRPMSILEIKDARNQVLESNQIRPDAGERILPAATTYILTDILKGVPQMGLPVAAKSGTTSDFKDAWYVGYSSEMAVATWMGRTVTKPQPANESMPNLWGETGPKFVWQQYVKNVYAGRKPGDWPRPAEVVQQVFCKQTGLPALEAVPDLTINDIYLKPSSGSQPKTCGIASADSTGTGLPASASPSPGLLPSLSPSVPPIPSIGTSPPILPILPTPTPIPKP